MSKLSLPNSYPPEPKSTRAPIWNHWSRQGRLARCRYCTKTIFANTNNMRNHTLKHHGVQYRDDPSSAMMQPDLHMPFIPGQPMFAMEHHFPVNQFIPTPIPLPPMPQMQIQPPHPVKSDRMNVELAQLLSYCDISPSVLSSVHFQTFCDSLEEYFRNSVRNNIMPSMPIWPDADEMKSVWYTNAEQTIKSTLPTFDHEAPAILHVAYHRVRRLYQIYIILGLQIKIYVDTLFVSPKKIINSVINLVPILEQQYDVAIKLICSCDKDIVRELQQMCSPLQCLIFWSSYDHLLNKVQRMFNDPHCIYITDTIRDIFVDILDNDNLRNYLKMLIQQYNNKSDEQLNMSLPFPTLSPTGESWYYILNVFTKLAPLLKQLDVGIAMRVDSVQADAHTISLFSETLLELADVIPTNDSYIVSNFSQDILEQLTELSESPEMLNLHEGKGLYDDIKELFKDYTLLNRDVLSLCDVLGSGTSTVLGEDLRRFMSAIGIRKGVDSDILMHELDDFIRNQSDELQDPMEYWRHTRNHLAIVATVLLSMFNTPAVNVSFKDVKNIEGAFIHLVYNIDKDSCVIEKEL